MPKAISFHTTMTIYCVQQDYLVFIRYIRTEELQETKSFTHDYGKTIPEFPLSLCTCQHSSRT